MASNAPRWVWIFTPLVALSFAIFLFYLTTVPAGDDIDKITESLTEQAQQAKQALTNKAKSAANTAAQQAINAGLPDPVKTITKSVNNFEFFEILENKEVSVEEVVEYKSTPKGTDKDGNKIQYRLRTGSFKNLEGADRQKAQLIINGLSPQIESANVNGDTWYRVFTGPFINRSQMNKAQDQLADMGIQSMVIKQALN
ncbi:MAG: cell division protein FtsN [Psychrobacter glaciei]|jgi:cell division protein FtsN